MATEPAGMGDFSVVTRGRRSSLGTGSRSGELGRALVPTSQGTSPVPWLGVTPSPSPCRAAPRWKDALLHSQRNGLADLRTFLTPF